MFQNKSVMLKNEQILSKEMLEGFYFEMNINSYFIFKSLSYPDELFSYQNLAPIDLISVGTLKGTKFGTQP